VEKIETNGSHRASAFPALARNIVTQRVFQFLMVSMGKLYSSPSDPARSNPSLRPMSVRTFAANRGVYASESQRWSIVFFLAGTQNQLFSSEFREVLPDVLSIFFPSQLLCRILAHILPAKNSFSKPRALRSNPTTTTAMFTFFHRIQRDFLRRACGRLRP